ncbi:hypothetical protein MKW92_024128 [Papaver armeniacum]|nr:hypothetical protein MKW92_024128 [Papaver armeniacum]
MMILYNGYRSRLSAHYRLECGKDYDKALANPPKERTLLILRTGKLCVTCSKMSNFGLNPIKQSKPEIVKS